jgi:hypothetical protein
MLPRVYFRTSLRALVTMSTLAVAPDFRTAGSVPARRVARSEPLQVCRLAFLESD